MPKTGPWLHRAGLYAVAPLMVFTGLLLTNSPLLAGTGLFIGFLAHLALQDRRATRERTRPTERTNQP